MIRFVEVISNSFSLRPPILSRDLQPLQLPRRDSLRARGLRGAARSRHGALIEQRRDLAVPIFPVLLLVLHGPDSGGQISARIELSKSVPRTSWKTARSVRLSRKSSRMPCASSCSLRSATPRTVARSSVASIAATRASAAASAGPSSARARATVAADKPRTWAVYFRHLRLNGRVVFFQAT